MQRNDKFKENLQETSTLITKRIFLLDMSIQLVSPTQKKKFIFLV